MDFVLISKLARKITHQRHHVKGTDCPEEITTLRLFNFPLYRQIPPNIQAN